MTVFTGKAFGAGTDANVYIVFVGEIGETGWLLLIPTNCVPIYSIEEEEENYFPHKHQFNAT